MHLSARAAKKVNKMLPNAFALVTRPRSTVGTTFFAYLFMLIHRFQLVLVYLALLLFTILIDNVCYNSHVYEFHWKTNWAINVVLICSSTSSTHWENIRFEKIHKSKKKKLKSKLHGKRPSERMRNFLRIFVYQIFTKCFSSWQCVNSSFLWTISSLCENETIIQYRLSSILSSHLLVFPVSFSYSSSLSSLFAPVLHSYAHFPDEISSTLLFWHFQVSFSWN